MFGNTMELKMKVASLELQLANAGREKELAVEAAKNEIRKEMEKRLIESDMKRVDSIARLEAYKEVDPKQEFATIKSIVEDNMKQMPKMISDILGAVISNNSKQGDTVINKL